MKINDARRICNAVPREFDSDPYVAHCCSRTVGKGNSMNEIYYISQDCKELDSECCNYCLKKLATSFLSRGY